jgi:hypothetical protein
LTGVVRAAPDDVPAWRTLARQVGQPDDLAWLAKLDDAIDAGTAWQAVDLDGTIVGGMLLSLAPDEVAITWLDVAPSHRGRDVEHSLEQHATLVAAPRPVERR